MERVFDSYGCLQARFISLPIDMFEAFNVIPKVHMQEGRVGLTTLHLNRSTCSRPQRLTLFSLFSEDEGQKGDERGGAES